MLTDDEYEGLYIIFMEMDTAELLTSYEDDFDDDERSVYLDALQDRRDEINNMIEAMKSQLHPKKTARKVTVPHVFYNKSGHLTAWKSMVH